ncbi:MAG TPA: cysteine desulfurase-like protein [Solirubrobacteraceae bacterium]|nr:cysteine desulfurase-like protein [Solirubrobacteraceae bacterium]
MNDGLDLTAIRSRFSALGRQVNGFPAVYLDGPGGSQTPDSVAGAVADYLLGANANLGGPFETSVASDELVHDAHAAAADFLGCTEEEVVFGANTTTINFLLAHAVARTLEPGDEIIVTELDHDANVSPWLLVAGDRGLTVRTARLDPHDGTLSVGAVEELITGRTRVVAFTLASNALGSIPDAGGLANAAHAAGALAWVDGVHLGPHRRVDRAGLDADVLLTSAYKFFGPHLGVAAVRGELARSLPADRVRPSLEVPAGHRFETGTLSHEALAGFMAAIEYLESLGPDGADRPARLDLAYARIETHERDLTQRTLERLSEIPGLRLYGIGDPARADERTPTFCFNLDGWTPEALSVELGNQGLFTYHGNYYALGVMLALGLEESGGAVRAGYLHYTTPEEADRLCDTIASLAVSVTS